MLFKNLDGKYLTLKDCIEENKKGSGEAPAQTEPEEASASENEDAEKNAADTDADKAADEEKKEEKVTIWYVTDEVQQSQYINLFREAGRDAVILRHTIDTPFITHLESRDENIAFKRIDADVTEDLKGDADVDKEKADRLTALFRKALGKDKLEVRVENLRNEKVAAMVTLSEENRRMQDMMKMYGMADMGGMGEGETLVLNANHKLVKFVLEHKKSQSVPVICEQLYDLARISQHPLSQEEMTKFMKRSNEIMMLLTK